MFSSGSVSFLALTLQILILTLIDSDFDLGLVSGYFFSLSLWIACLLPPVLLLTLTPGFIPDYAATWFSGLSHSEHSPGDEPSSVSENSIGSSALLPPVTILGTVTWESDWQSLNLFVGLKGYFHLVYL